MILSKMSVVILKVLPVNYWLRCQCPMRRHYELTLTSECLEKNTTCSSFFWVWHWLQWGLVHWWLEDHTHVHMYTFTFVPLHIHVYSAVYGCNIIKNASKPFCWLWTPLVTGSPHSCILGPGRWPPEISRWILMTMVKMTMRIMIVKIVKKASPDGWEFMAGWGATRLCFWYLWLPLLIVEIVIVCPWFWFCDCAMQFAPLL